MPADERATLTPRERAVLIVRNCASYGSLSIVAEIEDALKEADRLAREDAARIAKRHAGEPVKDPGNDFNKWAQHGERMSALRIESAIRASITTDEG